MVVCALVVTSCAVPWNGTLTFTTNGPSGQYSGSAVVNTTSEAAAPASSANFSAGLASSSQGSTSSSTNFQARIGVYATY
jgi:hypothetical protein